MTATRRTILGGMSTLAAALGPDGELLAPHGPWLASVKAFEAALTVLDDAERERAPIQINAASDCRPSRGRLE